MKTAFFLSTLVVRQKTPPAEKMSWNPTISYFKTSYLRHTRSCLTDEEENAEERRTAQSGDKTQSVREMAYYIWLNTGREDAEANWLEAEKSLAASD